MCEAGERIDVMVDPNDFEIHEMRDGSLVLSCGRGGMESDLVFAAGAMVKDDPVFSVQREILEFIVDTVKKAGPR